METNDVIVVGAGLAGLQAARLLGKKGLRVTLIDRRPSVAATIQTTGIFVRRTWEDFPLPPAHLGRPIRDVILYAPSLRSLPLHADDDEFRIGDMQWIYAAMLEECARAGVRWIPGARVLACEGGGVTIERHGRHETIAARYVVGADGARSLVARQLGLDRNRDLLVGLEEIVAAPGTRPALHCFVDPRLAPGYIGWVATDGESAHIGVGGHHHGFDAAASLAAFRKRVAHIAGGRAVERRAGLIPVNGVLRHIANDRGLLVGDAAGAVSPLTAGGLDGAMRLSRFAADVIAAYLEHEDAAILRQYSGAQFQTRFFARRCMRRLLGALSHPLLIELAFSMPFFHTLASHVFFSRGSFPEPLTATAARGARGRSLART